jgi:TRAP transporter TAXI family solute receptor
MAIYPELFTLVVNKNSNIKTLNDIKNKKINIGNSGSGNEASAKILFEASNIYLNELKEVSKLKSNAVNKALESGKIDGYFYMVGHPTASIKEISYTTDIDIVPLDGKNIDNLIKKHPYYTKEPIKAGLYKGINKDIPTYGVKALLVAHKDTDEKIVYYIVKSIIENFHKFQNLHPAYKNTTKKSLLEGISTPLHNGAKKYFKEIKLIK